jgi:hypothetical protein
LAGRRLGAALIRRITGRLVGPIVRVLRLHVAPPHPDCPGVPQLASTKPKEPHISAGSFGKAGHDGAATHGPGRRCPRVAVALGWRV